AQVGDVFRCQAVRFAETLFTGVQRMGEDCSLGLFQFEGPEFQATSSLFGSIPRERSAPIISASTATAISAGLAAPIFRPIGARIRSIAADETPDAASRSTRLA